MLPVLNIHEAIPGHYAQLVYANRSPSLIKSIFGNGAMVEGWAVYAERMMLESGYGEHKAEAWLIYSKWNLRSVTNTILDYGVHVLGHHRGRGDGSLDAPSVPNGAGSARQMAARHADERAAHQLLRRLLCDSRPTRAAEARARRRLPPEDFSRAVLELRQRARAGDSRADDGAVAHERYLPVIAAPSALRDDRETQADTLRAELAVTRRVGALETLEHSV